MRVNEDVYDINKVTQVIENHPKNRRNVLHVPKYSSADNKDIIINYSHAHDSKPLYKIDYVNI